MHHLFQIGHKTCFSNIMLFSRQESN